MPGDNCAVLGCGSCRRKNGIGIFKLPKEEHKQWREDWLNELTKSREVDADLRERIKKNKVFICERHFDAEEIEICKSNDQYKPVFRVVVCT